jgi:maleate cis-trans isomerase
MNIGLMVPANNTTMARELPAWLGTPVMVRTLKIPRGEGLLTEETVPAYVERAKELAKSFAGIDTVVYGCTAAGFIMGPQADSALAADLERITGKRVVTTARAMIEVLKHTRQVAVVTPYADAVNRQLARFLEQSGIEVARLAAFGAQSTEELGRITSSQVAALARETMAPDCEALFIACSQLPTYDIVPGLQREFGRPVWSSIQATAHALKQ